MIQPRFRLRRRLLLFLAIAGASACGDAPEPGKDAAAVRPDTATVRSDTAALGAATNARIEAEGNGPGTDVPRRYAVVDLDGDGTDDGLVLLQGAFCGSGGCSLYVFRGAGDGFEFVSSTSLVRGPFIVSEDATNGWRDLLLVVSGGGMAAKAVRLTYDGSRYPSNPSVLPAASTAGPYDGRVVFPVTLGGGDLSEFSELVGSYPRDVDLWNRDFLARRLEVLIRGRTDDFEARMQTQGPVSEEGGVYYVTGNMDNRGGLDGAILLADPSRNVLKAWILTDGRMEMYEEVPVSIERPADVRATLNNWSE